MRHITIAGAAVLWGIAGLVGPAEADASLAGEVAGLEVAAEQRAGYDRERFGDYDRDSVLERNFDAFATCVGYYSRYDAVCYELADFGGDRERADDEVEIDHRVALAEAWDSGAHAWGAAKLDAFAGDPGNLVVMTAGLNSSKSDLDIVGWTPPHPPSTCHYVGAYVATKVKYGLSVDQAEKATLVTVAEECDPGDDPGGDQGGQGDGGDGGDTGRDREGGEGGRSGQPDAEDESPKPTRTTPTVTEDDTAPAADSDDEGALPLTGSPTGVITGVALVLLAAGAVTLAGLRKKNRKV